MSQLTNIKLPSPILYGIPSIDFNTVEQYNYISRNTLLNQLKNIIKWNDSIQCTFSYCAFHHENVEKTKFIIIKHRKKHEYSYCSHLIRENVDEKKKHENKIFRMNLVQVKSILNRNMYFTPNEPYQLK